MEELENAGKERTREDILKFNSLHKPQYSLITPSACFPKYY